MVLKHWFPGPLALLHLLLLLAPGCDRSTAPAGSGTVATTAAAATAAGAADCACARERERVLLRAFLDREQPRYEQAIARARSWLDALRVDPLELRQKGIKGKKKLVELIDAYVRLHDIAPEAERPALLERIRAVAAPTYRPEYHDMQRIGDVPFKQDATSYLRAAYLLEHVGLETTLYRKEIAAIQPRLDAQMKRRGAHQRMAFHWYYQHFGLMEPFPLDQGYQQGVIASRRDPYEFADPMQVYALTHEIFVPYRFGEKLDADFFDEEEKSYLRHALDRLTVHYLMRNDPDLVSELVSCIRFLKLTDLPVYREALAYLLAAQLPDGKWGSYEHVRPRLGDYVEQGFYLHTTAVAIDALSVAFHYREDSTGGDRPPLQSRSGAGAQAGTRQEQAATHHGKE